MASLFFSFFVFFVYPVVREARGIHRQPGLVTDLAEHKDHSCTPNSNREGLGLLYFDFM